MTLSVESTQILFACYAPYILHGNSKVVNFEIHQRLEILSNFGTIFHAQCGLEK
jgi:hypothetical protein